MNTISDRADISRILMQVRDMQAQMEDGALKGVQNDIVLKDVSGSASIKSDSAGFGSMLKQAVNAVNDSQSKSGELQTAYEMGDPNVDLTEVMIQMQKASVSFEAMTQVRNKMITAYQEVMNMQV
ncbi:MAG: flagellar hook-basal body complex protein FliE [Pseudohongiellaceae bacterium]|jgi:flagellar hook-basal body complex protein FliE